MDIYSLTNQYKQTIANETDSSLRSCELLYEIQSVLLDQHDNNSHNKQYQKAIAAFRKDVGISKALFNKRVAVGSALIKADTSNEIRTMSVDAIYKQFCLPPKTPKPVKEKVDWELKYKELKKELEKQEAELEAENSKLKEQLAELQARREKDHEEFERHAKKIMARMSV
ncbi:hypothetical protein UFOVP787_84 [uncultured Caudovirales phage]|uniref:Uncharacterized protein n=1 Tax=uncultured Caudovirales phage TaxID=2100421 RepID=A0A6J5P0G3_9CAUD|nr:hypothetical protein UFOVP787_84 [uncultured Caudovirales phage]